MLVIFKCKAAGDIIMFEENAKPILDLFGREAEKGIILATEVGDAIVKLENEIARRKIIEAQEKIEREAERKAAEQKLAEREAKAREDGDIAELEKILKDRERVKAQAVEPVGFAARAYPLMEMLKRAQKKNKDIVWGV